MIVLDSNVVSELMKQSPAPAVIAWLNAQTADDAWTTAVTVFEVRYGLALMADGRRRQTLTAAFEQVLQQDLGGRVLALDAPAATETSDILAKCSGLGRPMDLRDGMIAGIVSAQANAILATRNTRHFADAGIQLVDPWQGGSAVTRP